MRATLRPASGVGEEAVGDVSSVCREKLREARPATIAAYDCSAGKDNHETHTLQNGSVNEDAGLNNRLRNMARSLALEDGAVELCSYIRPHEASTAMKRGKLCIRPC